MKRQWFALFICLLITLGGCANGNLSKSPTDKTPPIKTAGRYTFEEVYTPHETEMDETEADIKVGFMFVGIPGDYGFTYEQNQGRLALIDEFGVETMVKESVPEDESCLAAIQELIDGGCTIIFSCSYGFMEYTVQMAEKYPDIYFFHCSGYEQRENLSAYFGRMYQIRYLTGIAAGLKTETNKIGYIAAFPTSEVIRGANAFALGVKSVNPNAEIYIKWSDTWNDPAKEKELAVALINEGCDVITQHQDTVSPQIAAEEAGVWSIGYNSPMGFFAPNAYLTGAIWNWSPYMIAEVQKIIDGTWESSNYWGGIEDGIVALDKLTKNAAPGTSEAVEQAIASIKNGFDIFEGPIYDNEGNLRVTKGSVLTDNEKLSMYWFVDNITKKLWE